MLYDSNYKKKNLNIHLAYNIKKIRKSIIACT